MSRSSNVRLPRARRAEELIIEPVMDEVLVYDQKLGKAHRLNRAAALVWRHCDGRSTVDKALEALKRDGLPAEKEVIDLAIAQLTKAKLVEPVVDWSSVRFRSRRTLLKQLGLMTATAVALPIVQSIVAPSIAQAASCFSPGHACTLSSDCCPGLSCIGPTGAKTCQ